MGGAPPPPLGVAPQGQKSGKNSAEIRPIFDHVLDRGSRPDRGVWGATEPLPRTELLAPTSANNADRRLVRKVARRAQLTSGRQRRSAGRSGLPARVPLRHQRIGATSTMPQFGDAVGVPLRCATRTSIGFTERKRCQCDSVDVAMFSHGWVIGYRSLPLSFIAIEFNVVIVVIAIEFNVVIALALPLSSTLPSLSLPLSSTLSLPLSSTLSLRCVVH